jgi:hypothetical protein
MDVEQFCVFQPDGFQHVFGRDPKDPSTIRSRIGWTGRVEGDTAICRCYCLKRGSILEFKKGRLVAMETQGKRFNYVYEENRVAEIRHGGKTVLRVLKDHRTGAVRGLQLHKGEPIQLERGARPRVQVIGSERSIGGTSESLSRITWHDGTVRSFKYGVDGKLNPTLATEGREIIWDAASHKVMRDGDWTYRVTPGGDSGTAIGRSDSKGRKEFWHRNESKGEETVEWADGTGKITTWFTSGKLRGRTRKEVVLIKGFPPRVCESSYDENGRLIRIRRDETDTLLVYEKDGRLAALVQGGKIIQAYTSNAAALVAEALK